MCGCRNPSQIWPRRSAVVQMSPILPARLSVYAAEWQAARMCPWVGRSSGPVSLSPSQSCPGCTTNTSGYDFRKGHLPEPHRKPRPTRVLPVSPWLNKDVQDFAFAVHGTPDVQLSAVETPL